MQRVTKHRDGATAHIQVRGGYHPDVVRVPSGEPIRLVFRREETAACSERVVFPAFGKSAMLPPFRDTVVEVTPSEPGEYPFSCQMGMLHGLLIVEEAIR